MSRLKITFNEEQLKLIRNIRFEQLNDAQYVVDTYSLWGGSYIYEDMAYILGMMDHMIPGTIEDVDGPKFDEEAMAKFTVLDEFIVENIGNIEGILHQFCTEGIQPGVTYWCNRNEGIWHKEEKQPEQ